ncbi:DNA polymerase ligase N-terminal domain-containing protein [Streptomyces sp. NBRC 109706]|uniref:DNA polymerase ligase N-terminal domain-containing protein n=1 Tax=Streptomyces sp. NBRC 109706 TaxID=1550035 RepID=UPI00099CAAA8
MRRGDHRADQGRGDGPRAARGGPRHPSGPAARDALGAYRERRDFSRTSEPEAQSSPDGAAARFVVQIHDASSMHFDFRLEAEGVLKSWAVPKGPSTDPQDKRLAMPTEDHPLAYRDFEGTIAEGEYGAGTVIIWDEGTWRQERGRSVTEALERGHLSFRLDGRKLRGGFALTRFRAGAWLLVKRDDTGADPRGTPDPKRARSARTGRTLRQTAADAG